MASREPPVIEEMTPPAADYFIICRMAGFGPYWRGARKMPFSDGDGAAAS
jgi:hypothetical protein